MRSGHVWPASPLIASIGGEAGSLLGNADKTRLSVCESGLLTSDAWLVRYRYLLRSGSLVLRCVCLLLSSVELCQLVPCCASEWESELVSPKG